MKVNFCSLFIVAVVISTGCSQKPRITTPFPREFIPYPEYPGELVIDQGETFHLRCEHNTAVNWSFPSFVIPLNENEETPWVVNLHSYVNTSSNTHVSELQIVTPTRRETGYFYCKNMLATSNEDPLNAAHAYVYIRDLENIFVKDEEDFLITYQMEYKPFTIDACRTSSPDVDVKLLLESEDSNAFLDVMDPMLNLIDSKFDSKTGFSLKQARQEFKNYKCVGERKNDKLQQSLEGEIHVFPHKDFVQRPEINSTVLHAGVDSSLTLDCIIVVDSDVLFLLFWVAPNTVDKNRLTGNLTTSSNTQDQNGDLKKVGKVSLTINPTSPSDTGEYKCIVKDHANNTEFTAKNITIFTEDTKFINLTEQEPIEARAGESIKWVVPYWAHPAVNITWTFKEGIIGPAPKHVVTISETETKLEVLDINKWDSGNYTLTAQNALMSKNMTLSLMVRYPPKISRKFPEEQYYTEKKTYNLTCAVEGYPEPDISWYFSRCDNPPNCLQNQVKIVSDKIIKSKGASTYFRNADLSGYITCKAENSEGSVNLTTPFWVSDVKDGFESSKLPSKVFAGDNITLECTASKYNFTDNITWSFQGSSKQPVTIRNDTSYKVMPTSTHFSYKSSLIIYNATSNDSGTYNCNVIDTLKFTQNKAFNVDVKELKFPSILTTNMKGSEISVKMNDEVNFTCKVHGEPKPVITWYKDGILLDSKSKTIRFHHENQTMIIIAAFEEGTYSCRATNRVGAATESIKLTFKDKQTNTVAISIIAVISVIVLVLIILLTRKIMKEKQLRKEFREIGLEQFERGAVESLNQELPIDDQAELLPYDRKWEFPSEKLKLGKQLGAGAFGVVMKADAMGIMEGEAVSTVAVKMVKRNADSTYIKALASELKIMVHLGKHLNVVNLLGACTKNLNKRELYVIVEYCRFGNLHNYLLRHRCDFIDQVDPTSGKIDPDIGADIFARHESIVAKNRRADSEMSVEFRPSPSSSDSREVNSGAALISMTPVGGEDGMMLSNNSIQPEWRSNYGGDYKGNVRPICTRDLLCWAFQVARGMDYLAGRKVLHGDLAARNILLSDDNIVKICDFGLAKSMYKSDNYRKKGDGPLPIKWMAIESIRDRVFSTQSDVWSFGIVLWEFFSLAKTPYPGMEADEKLYNKLVEGYRMDQPDYATKEIQNVMDRCWSSQPGSRPSFGELSEHLGNMLEDSIRMHYIDLNDPYMSMNVQWREGQRSDYLAMVTAPTYDNMVGPVLDEIDLGRHYVNGSIMVEPTPGTSSDPDDSMESGYLLMKPSSVIFSPRALDSDKMFNFPQKRHSHEDTVSDNRESRPLTNGSEEYKNPSLKPKLVNNLNKTSGNSYDGNMDMGDVKESRPNFSPSFSNPSYASMPPVGVVPDNYINIPQKMTADSNMYGKNGGNFKADDNLNSLYTSGSTAADGYLIPRHGHNLSNASSGFQSDSGDRSSLN